MANSGWDGTGSVDLDRPVERWKSWSPCGRYPRKRGSRLKRYYSLRSPFGPHGTTCVTPLRYVPTAAS